MADVLVAPNDDAFERSGAVLAIAVNVGPQIPVIPVLVAPENLSNYSFPIGIVVG